MKKLKFPKLKIRIRKKNPKPLMKKKGGSLGKEIWVLLTLFFYEVIVLSLGKAMSIGTFLLWGIATFLTLSLILEGFYIVPNKPPSFGLIIRLGKRLWMTSADRKLMPLTVDEGLHWVFLKEILYKIRIIIREKISVMFEPQQVLTPDNTDLRIPISIIYSADRYNPIKFLDLGGHGDQIRDLSTGVIQSFKETMESKIRLWSRHPMEGPQTWEEMLESSLKMIDYLTKLIGQYCKRVDENGDEIPPGGEQENTHLVTLEGLDVVKGYDYFQKIHSDIPTAIGIDWYLGRKPSNWLVNLEYGDGSRREEYEKRKKEKDLRKPEEVWRLLLEKVEKQHGENSEKYASKKTLRDELQQRIELLEKLEAGTANVPTKMLGILIHLFSITQIEPFGEVYEKTIQMQKEQKERVYETYEVKTDLRKAKMLIKKVLKSSGNEMSIKEAYDIIMSYKMVKEGKGFVYKGDFGPIAGLSGILDSIMKGGKS